ncbi:MAG: Rpn family recombination-promoting nuclease/putative transposase [Chlamydiota bacterium]
MSQFLDPKNDLAFKRIFGKERNKDILIHFLNDIFAGIVAPIVDVDFLSPNQDPEIAAERKNSVDVLCKDNQGRHVIIEMQVANEAGFEKRAQHYAAKTYIEQRDKGIAYKDLKEVIFLAILQGSLTPSDEDPEFLSHHHMLNIKNHKRQLKDFSFSFIELSKFKKKKTELHTIVDKWAYFFKSASKTQKEDLEAIIGSDLVIKRAYSELDRYGWSVDDLRVYDSIDRKQCADKAILEQAIAEGLAKGEAIGEAKVKIEMA